MCFEFQHVWQLGIKNNIYIHVLTRYISASFPVASNYQSESSENSSQTDSENLNHGDLRTH